MKSFLNGNTITYDGNEQENYSIILNNKVVAEMHLGEDGAIDLVDSIKVFVAEKGRNDFDFIEIKNDGDKLGVIVDIWQTDECIETIAFWFDDFIG